MNEIKIGSTVTVKRQTEAVGWAPLTPDRKPDFQTLEYSGKVDEIKGEIITISSGGFSSQVNLKNITTVEEPK